MSVLLVVNTAPYGSEGPYNAFRLADALALRGEHVELFLLGDAVGAAKAGQDPRGAHASLTEDQLVAHARVATTHDLAEVTVRSDRVVSL